MKWWRAIFVAVACGFLANGWRSFAATVLLGICFLWTDDIAQRRLTQKD